MQKLSFALSVLVLPFTFHSIQSQAAQTKTGTATVSGRVTLKGEPARGVMVVLQAQSQGAPNAPRARADESGRFHFTSVSAGRYSVYAVAPGYVSPGDVSYGMRGKSLLLADGEKVDGPHYIRQPFSKELDGSVVSVNHSMKDILKRAKPAHLA